MKLFSTTVGLFIGILIVHQNLIGNLLSDPSINNKSQIADVNQFWQNYSNFKAVLVEFRASELRDYERLQRAEFDAEPEPEDRQRLLEIERTAFIRAYPELADRFKEPIFKDSYKREFHQKYSYGFRRALAWNSLRLAYSIAKDRNSKIDQVIIDLQMSHMQSRVGRNQKVQEIASLGYDGLVRLAVCEGYKAAVKDVLNALQIRQQLKLAGALAYMLLLRAEGNNIPFDSEDEWRTEIDRALSESDKQNFASLMTSNEKLRAELAFCGK